MQFQADVLGVAVERPDMIETTAAGAAALTGLALGVWPGIDAFLEGRHFTRFEPSIDADTRNRLSSEWDRAIRAALSWARAD
jgi:glycerol kinase